MKTNKEIANTILEQLGGNRFIAMTGSRVNGFSKESLNFKLIRNKSKANFLNIKLNSLDLYDVKFNKFFKHDLKLVKEFNNVYAEDLKELFTKETGLNVSL